jgi:hypothetical protein
MKNKEVEKNEIELSRLLNLKSTELIQEELELLEMFRPIQGNNSQNNENYVFHLNSPIKSAVATIGLLAITALSSNLQTKNHHENPASLNTNVIALASTDSIPNEFITDFDKNTDYKAQLIPNFIVSAAEFPDTAHIENISIETAINPSLSRTTRSVDNPQAYVNIDLYLWNTVKSYYSLKKDIDIIQRVKEVSDFNENYNPDELIRKTIGKDTNQDGIPGDLIFKKHLYLMPTEAELERDRIEKAVHNRKLRFDKNLQSTIIPSTASSIDTTRTSSNDFSGKSINEKIEPSKIINTNQDSYLRNKINMNKEILPDIELNLDNEIFMNKEKAFVLQTAYNLEYRTNSAQKIIEKYFSTKNIATSTIAEARKYAGTSFNNSRLVFDSLSKSEMEEILIKYQTSTIKDTMTYALEEHSINIKNIYSFLNNAQKTLNLDFRILKTKMTDEQTNILNNAMNAYIA